MTPVVWQFVFMVIWWIGTARLVRLLVADHFPPVEWLRGKWYEKLGSSHWRVLIDCLWCSAPWLALPGLILGTLFHWVLMPEGLPWYKAGVWLFFVWMAVSYLISIFVRRDEPDQPEE